MHRFFIPPEWIQVPLVRFQGETVRQIVRVLRLTQGEFVTVLDGNGTEHSVRLTRVGRERVEGDIITSRPASGEPLTNLSLYVGMTQRAKFEWILQKGTELGVSAFIPVITSRSLVRETTGGINKVARWESILREAAEQSGRGKIPKLLPVVPFSKALIDGKKSNALCLI
ncbi:MAG: RsmE family RNA methyltransferase, partial [Anaerolineaceae bacterium]